ncbi:MAG: biosynthetic-type acetolactate synthase large subunit [Candidatus Aminicenantes bacterium]|nr:biosynthetic-type acetolactate synthase large subunit [Candidatus Aminicenantes bacterium]
MYINGARIVVESLFKEKVDTVFCYIGGAVIPIFDALHKHGRNLRLIQPRHEQGGTHAADGYARSTGKTGVVIVTSGPGATNTITGITTAYMDSIPMVVITGQVPTGNLGTDAFQEADITGITIPITKANFLVKNIEDLAPIMKQAFHIARTGRPGPVVVDIPSDIQKEKTRFDYPEKFALSSYKPKENGHPGQIKAAMGLIQKAKRPLILVGGGVISSGSTDIVNQFIDRFGIPAVATLMGRGINPRKEELYLGGIGMHGSQYGNYAIQKTDLLIALGSRFSDRILGDVVSFAPKAKIIHVDIDPAEIGKNKNVHVPIVGNIRSVVSKLLEMVEVEHRYGDWILELTNFRNNHPMTYTPSDGLKPQYLIQLANNMFPEDAIVVSDVGQNQMWVSQYYQFKHPRCYLSSGGLGTMGFALPASIGAKIGNPHREVLMVAGDGGFQMNIQELATIRKYGLNIKMLVLDNAYLGMVRQWQQLLCKKRYMETEMMGNPDFAEIARVFGIKSRSISRPDEAETAMSELAESSEAMLIHAKVEREENVLPMVPAGKSLDSALTQI